MDEKASKIAEKTLPENRRQLFFRTIKAEWKTLFMCGFTILLFSLPLHAFQIYDDLYGNMLSSQYAQGLITEEEVNSLYRAFLYIRRLAEIFLYVIFSIGLSGVARVIRSLAFGKGVKFGADFKTGASQNARQYAVIGLIAGVIKLAISYLVYESSSSSVYLVTGSILIGYSLLFLVPVAAYLTAVIAVYDNRFYGNIKTALGVFIRSFFRSVGIIILLLLPYCLQLIPNIICHIVFRVVLSLLSGSIMFIWFLCAFSRFDEIINAEQHPELFGRGLRR